MLGVLYGKSHRRPEEGKHRSGKNNNGEGGHEKGDQEGDLMLMVPRQDGAMGSSTAKTSSDCALVSWGVEGGFL